MEPELSLLYSQQPPLLNPDHSLPSHFYFDSFQYYVSIYADVFQGVCASLFLVVTLFVCPISEEL